MPLDFFVILYNREATISDIHLSNSFFISLKNLNELFLTEILLVI